MNATLQGRFFGNWPLALLLLHGVLFQLTPVPRVVTGIRWQTLCFLLDGSTPNQILLHQVIEKKAPKGYQIVIFHFFPNSQLSTNLQKKQMKRNQNNIIQKTLKMGLVQRGNLSLFKSIRVPEFSTLYFLCKCSQAREHFWVRTWILLPTNVPYILEISFSHHRLNPGAGTKSKGQADLVLSSHGKYSLSLHHPGENQIMYTFQQGKSRGAHFIPAHYKVKNSLRT